MPHERCRGRWINSRLKPKNTGVVEEDGEITVNDHAGEIFTGTHHRTGASLTNAICDGVHLCFTRITSLETVNYSGKVTPVGPNRDIIENGEFTRVKHVFNAAGLGQTYSDSGDWTGEKVT
jgi:hypothetical protein